MKRHLVTIVIIVLICLVTGCGKVSTSDVKREKETAATEEKKEDKTKAEKPEKDKKESAIASEKTAETESEDKKEEAKKETAAANGQQAETPQKAAVSDKAAAGNNSSGSTPKTAPAAPAQPSKPAHTHTWVAITVQQPVYETQPVFEEQPVYEWVSVCNGCGAVMPSREHIKQHVLNGENGSTSTKQVQTGTQRVQVGTKQVQTGTKTVTTGYKCSGCGATK